MKVLDVAVRIAAGLGLSPLKDLIGAGGIASKMPELMARVLHSLLGIGRLGGRKALWAGLPGWTQDTVAKRYQGVVMFSLGSHK